MKVWTKPAVREQEAQLLQVVERTAEHQVRHHHRGVEREADEVAQVIGVHAAAGRQGLPVELAGKAAVRRVREDADVDARDCTRVALSGADG